MRGNLIKILVMALLVSGPVLAGQDVPAQETPPVPAPEPIFVRLTLYPTASLSRYDYNNDIDLYEVRAYAEIRRESQAGEVVTDANVRVLSQILDFQTDHYEKKILVDKNDLPDEVEVSITLAGRPPLKRTFPLPSWLIIENPKPDVVEPGRDMAIGWRFSGCSGTVNVRVYDFRKGGSVSNPDNVAATELVVPAEKIPPSTIIRIYIISSWISKQYLGGPEFVRGSEINVIPWSQVFVRTK